MTRPAQQTLHFPRPVLFLNFDECLEFPQIMRVAQRVPIRLSGCEIRFPMVMDDNAEDVFSIRLPRFGETR